MKIINEAETKGLVDLVANIADATDKNDHTGAPILLAQFLKNKKAEKALLGISACHDYFGSMPSELGKVRSMITAELLDDARHKYAKIEYDMIKGAF